MKKKMTAIVVGIIIILLLNTYVRGKKTLEQVPEFIFSYAENQSKDYPTTLGAYKFAELVEESTNGRIRIMVQAKGELGDEKSVIQQLQFGGIDFARISLVQIAEIIPKYNVLQMPYLYKDSKHMWRVLDSEIGDVFLKETENFEMVGLSWYDAGARNFYNAVKPINTLEDIQGLKIRVQESELMKDVVEALGAAVVPMVYDDVYSSLERGIIDGAENNLPSYESTGHYEVAQYYTIDEHNRVPEIQLCAQATWDKLSKKDQEIIGLCAKKSALYERELWAIREKQSQEIAIQKGVKIVRISAEEKARFQAAVVGVYEKYCADYMDIINVIIKM